MTKSGRAGTFGSYLLEHPASMALLEEVRAAVRSLGPVEEHETKSQLAFRRRRTVAAVWAPGQYLGRGAALVLTLSFPESDPSPRWKEIVEPSPGVFTHHLELHEPADIDDEVRAWLERAYAVAG